MKITKTQLKQIIREELAEYSQPGRLVKEVSRGISKEWWLATGDDRIKVIRDIYKRAGQVPPAGPQARADAWEKLIKDREARLARTTSIELEQDVE
jgi:hypothetical protein